MDQLLEKYFTNPEDCFIFEPHKEDQKNIFFPDYGSSDNFTEFSNNDIDESTTQNDDEQATTFRGPSGPSGLSGPIFRPIISPEEFFYDNPDTPWESLPEHTLEQSPCYPVISRDKKGQFYYCKLHPKEVRNIYLDTIEQHCKYRDPEAHKAEILRLLGLAA